MSIDRNEPDNKKNPAENSGENSQNIDLTDHPGLQKMNKNPNPRANENISDSDNNADASPESAERTDDVGSEITDGEAG
ncbi:MAG: hypothetical protein WKF97_01340 [Chitinophagaceae bacterium]